MKLLRTLAVPFLVLGLAASCGKKTPEGTTPPGETGAADAADSGSDAGSGGSDAAASGGEPGDAGADGGDEPAIDPSKVCDAEVSDTPRALFADNVLIRLPKGVDLVEQNEVFARITSSNTMSTCDAIVSFAAVGYFQTDAAKPPMQIRDETLKAARGVEPSEATWSEEIPVKGRDYSGAYELPEGKKGEPAIKGWIAFKEKGGITYWVAYETHPNAWNAVKKSFQESTRRLVIVKK